MKILNALLVVIFLVIFPGPAPAHVPYLETEDFSPTNRFVIPYKVEQSTEDDLLLPPEPNGKKPRKVLKGIYRAVVISNEDPDSKMKVQVKIDAIPEMGLLWAAPIVPLKENERILPAVGELVWISFREYNPNQPLWLGKITEESPPSYYLP